MLVSSSISCFGFKKPFKSLKSLFPFKDLLGQQSTHDHWHSGLALNLVWVHINQTADQVLRQISLAMDYFVLATCTPGLLFSIFALDHRIYRCWIFQRVQNTFFSFDNNKKINLYHQDWNGCLPWFLHRPFNFCKSFCSMKKVPTTIIKEGEGWYEPNARYV